MPGTPAPSTAADALPAAWRTGWPWTAEGSVADVDATGWPRITVVTPSYNQAPYLEATIRSVLLQGYPNLEYIVVDGGSTDTTAAVLRHYEEHFSWSVSEPDRGQSHALNKGFEHATGQIHAFLNSDDVFEPGALFACAEAFRSGAQWTVGKVRYWTQSGELWPIPAVPGRGIPRWLISCPVAQPGSLWSAALHHRVGPFREDLHYLMDYDFWLRLRLEAGVRPRWLDRFLARYRLHDESKTISHGEGFRTEAHGIVRRYESRLSPLQRIWVGAERRRRAASVMARDGFDHFQRGSHAEGVSRFLSATAKWPLILVDFRAAYGLLATLREGESDPPTRHLFPPYW